MKKIKIWLKTVRAPFFTACLVPTVVGTSLAFLHTGLVNIWYALLCLLGLIFLNTSVNLLNDYGDHISGNDEYNENFNPFSGGSRSIQNEELTPRAVFIGGTISLIMGTLIGLYLNYVSSGNTILILGLIGVFSVFFYTLGPIKIGYRGVGEVVVGINFGLLSVVGAYYLQTELITLPAVLAGVPVSLLIAAVLYINEYPDYEADKKVNKKTLVVLLGKKRARVGMYILVVGTFISIIVSTILGEFTLTALLTLITLPLAIKVLYHFHKNYDKFPEIIPANAGTIQLHLFTGLILGVSFIIARFL